MKARAIARSGQGMFIRNSIAICVLLFILSIGTYALYLSEASGASNYFGDTGVLEYWFFVFAFLFVSMTVMTVYSVAVEIKKRNRKHKD